MLPKIYDLSDVTFTDQDDIVPLSGTAVLTNDRSPIYFTVNTLAGNDIINADNKLIIEDDEYYGFDPNKFAFYNSGTLNTAEGNDSITGIVSQNTDYSGAHYGILNEPVNNLGGRIDTGDGNDLITGIIQAGIYGDGIGNVKGGSIDTGDGNDKIIGISHTHIGIKNDNGFINTGNGKDTITGTGILMGIGFINDNINTGSVLDTGKDNDTITGSGDTWGIYNQSATFNTNDGDDIIIGNSKLYTGITNYKFIYTAGGNDMITGVGSNIGGTGIDNGGIIDTGDSNDTITGTSGYSGIFNSGSIYTGNGNDIITGTGSTNGIDNQNTINTGNGEDSIIADGGFSGMGSVFLGNGNDCFKGFGTGNFNGGNGTDTLKLTSGSYIIGISGTTMSFTKNSIIMNTSEFEKLIAGNTIYNCDHLTNGQTIFVP